MVTFRPVWLAILGLVVGVIGAWGNLRALVITLLKIPIDLARGIGKIVMCPDPVSVQLAESLDNFAIRLTGRFSDDPFSHPRLFTASNVSLTTWLRHPVWGLDSYRRHLRALRRYEAMSTSS